jgi:hypothetical protein
MPSTDEAVDSATDAKSSATSLLLFVGYRGGGGRPTMSSLGVRKLADANDADADEVPSSCCCSKSGIVDGVR